MSVKDSLEKVFSTYQAARADQEWSLRELLQMLEAVAEVVQTTAGGISGDDDEWNQFVDDIEYFVEVYLVPIDLPGVGPIIENFIDSQMVGFVRPLLENIRPS